MTNTVIACSVAQFVFAAMRTNAANSELKRGASMARSFGLQVDVVSAERALELWPFLNAGYLLGAVHLP